MEKKMTNVSDQMGRSLEYIVVKKIIENNSKIKLLGNTINDQSRDSTKYQNLDEHIKSQYEIYVKKIISWINNNYGLDDIISIERFPDSLAKKGDVTDVQLIFSDKKINISLKHNHHALKHQRPGALAQSCGYKKNSSEDKEYRNKLKVVFSNFENKINNLSTKVTSFKEIKSYDECLIENYLYLPVCKAYADFLNKYAFKGVEANNFFKFILGNNNYIKIIAQNNEIKIHKYQDISSVKSLNATVSNNKYITISFSNKWEIQLRLHTASSKIKGMSLKFDTQPLKIPVPEEKI